jgi:hypothetical protein
MRLGVGEILRLAHKQKSKNGKIEVLRHYAKTQPAFGTFLQMVFDPRIKFLLPPGELEFNPLLNAAETVGRGAFWQHLRTMDKFMEGGSHPGLTEEQRVVLFRQLLETIDPLDAEAAMAMKDKRLPFKSLTYALLSEAFPQALPAEVEPVTQKIKKAFGGGKKKTEDNTEGEDED